MLGVRLIALRCDKVRWIQIGGSFDVEISHVSTSELCGETAHWGIPDIAESEIELREGNAINIHVLVLSLSIASLGHFRAVSLQDRF